MPLVGVALRANGSQLHASMRRVAFAANGFRVVARPPGFVSGASRKDQVHRLGNGPSRLAADGASSAMLGWLHRYRST
jgi:hypothetical protein